MTVLNAHFDGKQLVLDDPVPKGVNRSRRVRVLLDDELPKSSSLAAIARLAVKGKLPRDFAAQHEHYTKSAPKR